MLTVKVSWLDGFRFTGTGSYGYSLTTDIAASAGGTERGIRPTELLLFGIAACTGVDVVKILQKQRQELESLEIEVTGHQPEGYPKPFEKVEVTYRLKGRNLDRDKVAQAIELSETKYCSVSATVRHPGTVTTRFEILE